jgi:hypothetical protein
MIVLRQTVFSWRPAEQGNNVSAVTERFWIESTPARRRGSSPKQGSPLPAQQDRVSQLTGLSQLGVPIADGPIISVALMAAVVTLLEMAAEDSGPTDLYRGQDAALRSPLPAPSDPRQRSSRQSIHIGHALQRFCPINF